MILRRFGTRVLLLALATCCLGGAENDERPNIIFLLTDDQRADTLGCMGNSIIQTPNIDNLSAAGVTFDNAFVTTAICMTSRATILSGKYAARHGVWTFQRGFTPEELAVTYPGVLKRSGYRTGFIGKWGVGAPPEDFFDYNRGFPGQGNFFLEVDGQRRHLTSVMGDQALEFLESAEGSEPFCLSVSFKAPHVQDTANVHAQAFPFDPVLEDLYGDGPIPMPRLAAPSFFEGLPDFLKNSENRARWAVRFWGPERYQFSVKSYYRLITGVDVVVGRIQQKLADLGLKEKTIIVFVSDHGFFLGEFGLAGKWLAHDLSIRIPLIVVDPRAPERTAGSRRDEYALSVDLARTLLDLAGVPAPEEMQGRSLKPLIYGEKPEWRREFFYEHLFDHPRIPKNEAVRTERWKYVRYVEMDPVVEELYDLEMDPDETRNLAGHPFHAETLESLREKWARLREEAR